MITDSQLPMIPMPNLNDTHIEEMVIIKKLSEAALDDQVELVQKTLQELLKYMSLHFFDEEDLMEEALFPALHAHKSEHDKQLHLLQTIMKEFGKIKDVSLVISYVQDNLIPWIIRHIQTMDETMALYLQPEADAQKA
ncbi:MAG: hemerythrin family protein [Sulfurimonas sp.]|nr:hemerythrin family protein [Sulfurimonas sp.]